MSIHRSLAPRGALKRTRNVLTRIERLQSLKTAGKWKEEENSIFGIPKVRTQFKTAKKKAAKKETAEGAPGAAPAAGGAAPAAGAKPAAGAAGAAGAKAAPAAKADDKKAKK